RATLRQLEAYQPVRSQGATCGPSPTSDASILFQMFPVLLVVRICGHRWHCVHRARGNAQNTRDFMSDDPPIPPFEAVTFDVPCTRDYPSSFARRLPVPSVLSVNFESEHAVCALHLVEPR